MASPFAIAVDMRDEDAARRFLHCAYVDQYWFKYLSKHDPENGGIKGYREARNAFWLAAALASDTDFLGREKDLADQSVVDILKEEQRTKVDLMSKESMKCVELLANDAIPLLKSRPAR